IGYFSSVKRQARIAKVVGLGNGFRLAGLQKFLQQNLQYEVDRPDAYRSLAGDAVVNSPLFADNLLSFAVPYGLALQTLKLTRIHTSLLPPEIATARVIRKKKPWAVAAAASLLLGYTLSTVGNAYTNGVVHTPEFEAAEKEAGDFGSKVGSLKSAYDSEVGRRGAAQAKLEGLIKGRRSVDWLDVYNAVVDCLPRIPEGEPVPDEVNMKPIINLTEFSTKKEADVSAWFGKVPEAKLKYMPEAERTAGPSGEGYIVTLRGQHYFNDPAQPRNTGILFVINTFLKNLQQWQVQHDGYPVRDVRRLGLTHATIMEQGKAVPIDVSTKGRDLTAARGFGATGPMGPMGTSEESPEFLTETPEFPPSSAVAGTGVPGQPGSADVKRYEGTTFTIQLVLQYVPEADRAEVDPLAPAAAEGADGASADAASGADAAADATAAE
ncbi:MAG: hypothetical protein KDA58_05230, partial [Planctomycetaceae bacterium]|nr:hypothetical protein [Planctomycetaceae bacterium]